MLNLYYRLVFSMTIKDAKRGEKYTYLGFNNDVPLPKALARRHIQKGDVFTYAGHIGDHHILKFDETRIGLHHQFVKDIAIEKSRD